jgi:hypothetical protein
MIAKIHLKWTIGVILFLFLLTSYFVVSLYIDVQEVKTKLNTKDFTDLLYDPGNLIIISASEQEDYCRELLLKTDQAKNASAHS